MAGNVGGGIAEGNVAVDVQALYVHVLQQNEQHQGGRLQGSAEYRVRPASSTAFSKSSKNTRFLS